MNWFNPSFPDVTIPVDRVNVSAFKRDSDRGSARRKRHARRKRAQTTRKLLAAQRRELRSRDWPGHLIDQYLYTFPVWRGPRAHRDPSASDVVLSKVFPWCSP